MGEGDRHGRGQSLDGSAGAAIRRLVPADAPAYVAFRLAALALHPRAFTSSPEGERAKPLSWAEARLRDPSRPDDLVLGAFDAGGGLVGTAGLRRGARPKERHKATLFGMAVAPEAAGRGLGARLVAGAVAEARAIPGLLQIDLTVSEGNAALRLYAAAGFAVFGREPRAIVVEGVPVAKLHMVLMLDAPAAAG